MTEIDTLIQTVNGALSAALPGVVVLAYEPSHIYAPTLYTGLQRVEYERTSAYLGRRAWLRSRLVRLWQDNQAADEALYADLALIESAFDSSDLGGALAGKVRLETIEPGYIPFSGGKYRLLEIMTSAIVPKSTSEC